MFAGCEGESILDKADYCRMNGTKRPPLTSVNIRLADHQLSILKSGFRPWEQRDSVCVRRLRSGLYLFNELGLFIERIFAADVEQHLHIISCVYGYRFAGILESDSQSDMGSQGVVIESVTDDFNRRIDPRSQRFVESALRGVLPENSAEMR